MNAIGDIILLPVLVLQTEINNNAEGCISLWIKNTTFYSSIVKQNTDLALTNRAAKNETVNIYCHSLV